MRIIPCVIVQLNCRSSSGSSYYYYVTPTMPRFENSPAYPYDQMCSFFDVHGKWAYWSPKRLVDSFALGRVRHPSEVKSEYAAPRNVELAFLTEFDPAWEVERHARWKGTWNANSVL